MSKKVKFLKANIYQVDNPPRWMWEFETTLGDVHSTKSYSRIRDAYRGLLRFLNHISMAPAVEVNVESDVF